MKLIDTDETVIIVTGSDLRAEERDRPIAYLLKREIDRRGAGYPYRRAVVVGDAWYLDNRIFHVNPTIAVGGPGVNALSQVFAPELPTMWAVPDRAFIQAEWSGERKRVAIWGMDMQGTADAATAFIQQGLLDDLLAHVWRFRSDVLA
ncbi:MAG TPA: hypothetical protein VNK43_08560 [Gemmatimonadales bacterium]|nr:hypothetical protein [Gemmatimonadales bacterium]